MVVFGSRDGDCCASPCAPSRPLARVRPRLTPDRHGTLHHRPRCRWSLIVAADLCRLLRRQSRSAWCRSSASGSSRADATIAMRMMTLSVTETIRPYDYASIPTFVMMGMIVGKAGFGADIYSGRQPVVPARCAAGLASPPSPPTRPLPPSPAPRSRRLRCSPASSVPEMIRFNYSTSASRSASWRARPCSA